MADQHELLYNPRLLVRDFAEIFARWEKASDRVRKTTGVYLDVPYGPHDTEKMDIFRAKGASRALLMFIHGGYWRMLDKRDFSFIAPAFTDQGVTIAIPNYALCPAVEIEDIVRQMLQATAWLYRNGANFGAPLNHVYVAGHSAGGHLTAMMLAALWPKFSADLPDKVVSAGLSISGLYDLAPLIQVKSINNDVRLTPDAAAKVSPAFMPPATDAPLFTAVGGKENEGFHIQNRLIARNWKKVHQDDLPCPDDNHFSILDRLTDPSSALHRGALRMMGIVE